VPDLPLYLATPAIITKTMCDEEVQFEFDRMMLRSTATKEFVEGRITHDDFIDALILGGVHVDSTMKNWDEGICCLK
jgi:hypothetical protein